jgi:hypothetical protein
MPFANFSSAKHIRQFAIPIIIAVILLIITFVIVLAQDGLTTDYRSSASYCGICTPLNSCDCDTPTQTGLKCKYAPPECSNLGTTWQPDSSCDSACSAPAPTNPPPPQNSPTPGPNPNICQPPDAAGQCPPSSPGCCGKTVGSYCAIPGGGSCQRTTTNASGYANCGCVPYPTVAPSTNPTTPPPSSPPQPTTPAPTQPSTGCQIRIFTGDLFGQLNTSSVIATGYANTSGNCQGKTLIVRLQKKISTTAGWVNVSSDQVQFLPTSNSNYNYGVQANSPGITCSQTGFPRFLAFVEIAGSDKQPIQILKSCNEMLPVAQPSPVTNTQCQVTSPNIILNGTCNNFIASVASTASIASAVGCNGYVLRNTITYNGSVLDQNQTPLATNGQQGVGAFADVNCQPPLPAKDQITASYTVISSTTNDVVSSGSTSKRCAEICPTNTSSPSNTQTSPTSLTCDPNGDGVVDERDYTILYTNYGTTGATASTGDCNGDGLVNGLDLASWATSMKNAL